VVALDNFILENETTVAGALPPNDFICPGDKIETISCDFEDFGYCGWRMGEWNFDWELVNVSTPDTTSTHTHTISNTTNGAVFLAAAANNRPNGQSVSIFSKAVTTSMPKNTLLEFWYNMKGSGIDYLRVLIQENGVRRIVWERNGDQGTN
jgi:MAM domain, meprin/A5/mu